MGEANKQIRNSWIRSGYHDCRVFSNCLNWFTYQRQNTLNGTIQALTVEVYKNPNATQNCTEINFGDLCVGAVSNQTVYIKNSGTKSASLSMNVEDWDPIQAGSSLVLSWNRKDHILHPGELINATFTLDADESIEDFSDFSVNIIIESTQIEEL